MSKITAKENLESFKGAMDRVDAPFFLLYGTLLGAVREGDFIAHDTDIDVGIYEQDKPRLIHAIKELINDGFELIRTKFPDDLVTIMRDDEYIDVGIFRKTKLREVESYVYQRNAIDATSLDSLDSINFLGLVYRIPKNKEQLLTVWYGNNWVKPQKNYPASDLDTQTWKKIANRYFLTRIMIGYARKIKNLF